MAQDNDNLILHHVSHYQQPNLPKVTSCDKTPSKKPQLAGAPNNPCVKQQSLSTNL